MEKVLNGSKYRDFVSYLLNTLDEVDWRQQPQCWVASWFSFGFLLIGIPWTTFLAYIDPLAIKTTCSVFQSSTRLIFAFMHNFYRSALTTPTMRDTMAAVQLPHCSHVWTEIIHIKYCDFMTPPLGRSLPKMHTALYFPLNPYNSSQLRISLSFYDNLLPEIFPGQVWLRTERGLVVHKPLQKTLENWMPDIYDIQPWKRVSGTVK